MKIMKLHKDAKLPKYETPGSAGFDLSVIEGGILRPGEIKMFSTGLAFSLPLGFELQIRPRSGLAINHGITVVNAPGTVDSDFRAEVKVGLVNLSNTSYVIKDGERVCQGVTAKYEMACWTVVDELDITERGEGGFGSTGRD